MCYDPDQVRYFISTLELIGNQFNLLSSAHAHYDGAGEEEFEFAVKKKCEFYRRIL